MIPAGIAIIHEIKESLQYAKGGERRLQVTCGRISRGHDGEEASVMRSHCDRELLLSAVFEFF